MDVERNRRQSYRLDDLMIVRLRILDDESLKKISENFNAFRLRYSLNSHLKNQREQRLPRLKKIKKGNPDIAQYLEYLEMLVLQLAERIDENTDSYSDALEVELLVNLSASGARFATELPIEQGQIIEVGMYLSTIDTQVVVLAEAIRTETEEDESVMVSVQFEYIHPDDSEAIVRHLAKLQLQQLSARREM